MKVVLSCKEINARKRPLQVAFLFGLWYSFCMKTIFTYRDNIFNTDLVVIVGVGEKRLLNYAKKNFNEKSYTCIAECKDVIIDSIGDGGTFLTLEKDGFIMHVLILDDWVNDYASIDLLIHEITHYKQAMFGDRGVEKEHEFEVYFIQSTFRQIREKLNSKLK